jgi:regulator of protease activity HflC (stomatin/prohibitin superfamily)
VRISLRTVTLDVPPREIINRDNVTVSVNAVIYFRVLDPRLAIVEVENYLSATSQLAQLKANTRLPKTWFRRDWP